MAAASKNENREIEQRGQRRRPEMRATGNGRVRRRSRRWLGESGGRDAESMKQPASSAARTRGSKKNPNGSNEEPTTKITEDV